MSKQGEANRIVDKEYLARLYRKIETIMAGIPEEEEFQLSYTKSQMRFIFAYLLSGRQVVAEMAYRGITDPSELSAEQRQKLNTYAYRRMKQKKYKKGIEELKRYLSPSLDELVERQIRELLLDPSLSAKEKKGVIEIFLKWKEKGGKDDGNKDVRDELLGDLG